MAYSPAVISGSRFFRKPADSLMIRSRSALAAGRLANTAVELSNSAPARQAGNRVRWRVMGSMGFKACATGHLHGTRLLHPAADLAAFPDGRAEPPVANRLDHGLVEILFLRAVHQP